MIKKLLIANRGEIACRVIRSAKALGICCVAVYSDADANSLHVSLADEAYHIGPAPSSDSYLKQETILLVAKQSHCDAIHPGYGFLAENADFAKACEKNNIIFVGPSFDVINAMGSKSAAKALMEKAKVPVVPGYHGDNQDEAFLAEQAEKIKYPILIKAIAGGGGKGMRVVNSPKEFSLHLASAKRESKKSFSDDNVLLEKYLQNPRHIEVQVLADNHGHVIHLFERDCSIQRRQQKIIEEAPAPLINKTLREKLCKAAVTATKAINYTGAGTIEFLVSNNDFYFMEMNTRLQVEHPISEKITGIDLVAWQLRIAAGEKLHLKQNDIQINGHAIEARICAEDPQQDFLPATGTIQHYQTPQTDEQHVRLDTGIREGDTISIYYDSLIAKLICWASDRETAIHYLQTALADFRITGVHNNIDYLRAITQNEQYKKANLHTGFIPQHHEKLVKPQQIPESVYAYAALYLLLAKQGKQANPWTMADAWQMNQPALFQYQFINHQNEIVHVKALQNQHDFETSVNNQNPSTIIANCNKETLTVIADEQQFDLTILPGDSTLTVFGLAQSWQLSLFNVDHYYDFQTDESSPLTAPMPGTVVAILTKSGEQVEQGQALLVIEAMKMEHTIHAPHDGIISSIHYRVNDQVNEGEELVAFESETK